MATRYAGRVGGPGGAGCEAELRSAALDRGIDNVGVSIEALTVEVQVERERVERLEELLAERQGLLEELGTVGKHWRPRQDSNLRHTV